MKIITGMYFNFNPKQSYFINDFDTSLLDFTPHYWRITNKTKGVKNLKPGNIARVVANGGRKVKNVFITDVSDRKASKLEPVIKLITDTPHIHRLRDEYKQHLKISKIAQNLVSHAPKDSLINWREVALDLAHNNKTVKLLTKQKE